LRRFLFFGAHPDDETVGLGGTIAKLVEAGHEVYGITLTNGSEGYDRPELKDEISIMRMRELDNVVRFLGVKSWEKWGYEDYDDRLNSKEVLKREIAAIRRYRPHVIFTHYPEDRHRDHRNVSVTVTEAWWQAGERVLAEQGPPWRADSLYYFEVFSPIAYPSHISDISGTFNRKVEAMKLYESQLKTIPYVVQAFEGLNRFRGGMISSEFGEALLRSVRIPSRFEA
jgi:LmbE family N-acetylglucosaminyl deacetylase